MGADTVTIYTIIHNHVKAGLMINTDDAAVYARLVRRLRSRDCEPFGR
jgi:hypothetical protein